MDDAATICARLVTGGAVPRAELSALYHPAVRDEVERRLAHCGFALASSAYSDHYGIRLLNDAGASVLDRPSNLGLDSGTCALITVLWAKLALQKRTATDQQVTPDAQGELISDRRREQVQSFQPSIRFETLVHEFGRKLGGKVRLKSMLGQLRKMKFVEYRRLDEIHAGPLLELAIDGEKMIAFIRSRVLSQYLETSEDSATVTDVMAGLNQEVVRVLSEAGPLGIGDMEKRIGAHRHELKRALKELREDQRIEKIGVGSRSAYRIPVNG